MLKPREKFSIYGANALSEAELLAIIIQTGSKNDDVHTLATKLLNKYQSLSNLLDQSIEELCTNDGIGQVKAIKIKTIKQINISTSNLITDRFVISEPRHVHEITREYASKKQEHLIVICLNTKNIVININDVLQGTINQIVVHPREVFNPAIRCMASSIILVHNHPTGSVKPSKADIETTKQMVNIGELIGIPVVDHIIITTEDYYSICEHHLN